MTEPKNSLIEVLNNFGENLKQQICTNAIGKIIEYDPVKKVAKVQLLNKQKKKDGAVSVLPMLERVPVLTSHSTNYIIATDLKDELCLVLFCDHSIEGWQVTEGKEPFTPASSRRHNINDAICIIGLFAEKTQSKVTLAPKKENFDVLFADDKKLRIGNSNVELVKDVLNVIVTELTNITTAVTALDALPTTTNGANATTLQTATQNLATVTQKLSSILST